MRVKENKLNKKKRKLIVLVRGRYIEEGNSDRMWLPD